MIIVLTIWLGVTLASTRIFGRGFAGALMLIPAFFGAILVNTLPSHNKIGLLFSYWITSRGFFISSPSTSLTHVFPKSSLSHHLPFSLDGLDPSSLDTLNVCFIFTLPQSSIEPTCLSRDNNERNYFVRVRHWQCRWTVYVETALSTTVCCFSFDK